MYRPAYVNVREYLREQVEMSLPSRLSTDELQSLAVQYLSPKFPQSAVHEAGLADLVGSMVWWQKARAGDLGEAHLRSAKWNGRKAYWL